jgi:hypothetical protein
MALKPIDLPPDVAKAFVKHMRAESAAAAGEDLRSGLRKGRRLECDRVRADDLLLSNGEDPKTPVQPALHRGLSDFPLRALSGCGRMPSAD